jgi:hypothetical protein
MYKNDHLKNVSPALWINHCDSLTKVRSYFFTNPFGEHCIHCLLQCYLQVQTQLNLEFDLNCNLQGHSTTTSGIALKER